MSGYSIETKDLLLMGSYISFSNAVKRKDNSMAYIPIDLMKIQNKKAKDVKEKESRTETNCNPSA